MNLHDLRAMPDVHELRGYTVYIFSLGVGLGIIFQFIVDFMLRGYQLGGDLVETWRKQRGAAT